MNNEMLEVENKRLTSQLRRKDEIIHKLKKDKMIGRKEISDAWREIYSICAVNDNLEKELNMVAKEKEILEKNHEMLINSSRSIENDKIKLLFANATLKNKIEIYDKKVKEESEKRLKLFIEESILKEANAYEFKEQIKKINIKNEKIECLEKTINLNALKITKLENESKSLHDDLQGKNNLCKKLTEKINEQKDFIEHKEESFETLKVELNKMIGEKNNVGLLKEKPKKRKLRFFCF